MDSVAITYSVRARQNKNEKTLLWPSSYEPAKKTKTESPINARTAYRWVKQNMIGAGLKNVNATPKGLRHAFAIAAVGSGVPITTIRKWLGHSSLSTTEGYLNVTGEEEHKMVQSMWSE